jgi:hypothetical protein
LETVGSWFIGIVVVHRDFIRLKVAASAQLAEDAHGDRFAPFGGGQDPVEHCLAAERRAPARRHLLVAIKGQMASGRTGILRGCGVGPGAGREPARGALSIYLPQSSRHPVLADPAAPLMGPVVILASPNVHRDCQRPTLSGFTKHEEVQLR